MAWVEQVNRRSQKAKHYFDADTGKYRAEFTISDRHYHDGSAWQDVDESLVDDGADGYTKKCNKTRHQFRIAGGGSYRWYPRRNVTTEYVDITEIQYWTGSRWRTLNLPAAVWKQQSAEWDMANLYASITNTWCRIKTEFILKDSSAYTRLRFAVEFTGLSYNHETGEVTSTTDGLVWGRIDKPIAHDANDNPVIVTATYADGWIEWSADTTGATFPITVDPTFTDGYGGDVTTAKDVSIRSSANTWNYGATDYIAFGAAHKGLFEFALSSIAATATCDSATLYLYTYSAPAGSVSATLTIYSIASENDGWIEGTKTGALAGAGEPCWNAKEADGAGGVTTAWAGSAGLATSGTDYEASALATIACNTGDAQYTEKTAALTASRIEDWFGATNTNYGILAAWTNNSINGFCSSDHATTGYRPKLVVEYTAGATGPSVSDTVGAITESVTVRPQVEASTTDTVGEITEAVTVSPQVGASTSDTVGAITEAVTVEVGTPGIDVSDAVGAITESVTVSFALEISVSETIGVTDEPSTTTSDPQVSVTDGVTVTDTPTVALSSTSLTVDDMTCITYIDGPFDLPAGGDTMGGLWSMLWRRKKRHHVFTDKEA